MRSKKAASDSFTTLSATIYPHSFLYSGSNVFRLGYLGIANMHLLKSEVIKTAGNSGNVVEISTATAASGNADGECKET